VVDDLVVAALALRGRDGDTDVEGEHWASVFGAGCARMMRGS
jgi:hypothetical protein